MTAIRQPRGDRAAAVARAADPASRVASLSNAELERRLVENPEDIPTKDLAIISGISADKISRYEGWSGKQEDEQQRQDAVSRMLLRIRELVESGADLTLKVTPMPDAQVIDVTPVRRG